MAEEISRCSDCGSDNVDVVQCCFCKQLKCSDCMCIINVCVECMSE